MSDFFEGLLEQQKRISELQKLYERLESNRQILSNKTNRIRSLEKESEIACSIFDGIKKHVDEVIQETDNNFAEIEKYEVEDNMAGFWEEYLYGLKHIMKGVELEKAITPCQEMMDKLKGIINQNDEAIETTRKEINVIEQEITEIQNSIRSLGG